MLNSINKQKKFTRFLPDIFLLTCCMVSIFMSVIESRVNINALDWGMMFANAVDLNRGLVPYREIYIQYGLLTTLIHSFTLKVLGNFVPSIGIVTGIFYTASIYLCFLLWQKIMDKPLAALSAFLMFLIHPHIIVPWSNYFAYTFLLFFLLLFTMRPQRAGLSFLSGVFLGLCFLARQTYVLSVMTALYVYMFYRYYTHESSREDQAKKIAFMHFGLFVVVVIFLLFLFINSALDDWFLNIKAMDIYTGSFLVFAKLLLKFIYALVTGTAAGATKAGQKDIRSWIYTLVFFNTLLVLARIFKHRRMSPLDEKKSLIFLFGLITLFGYLQSLHVYEVFRLQNISSLGIGILLFCLYNEAAAYGKWRQRLAFDAPLALTIVLMASTAVFTVTSSQYQPWNRKLLFGNRLSAPRGINVLKENLYDEKMRVYYESINGKLNEYAGKFDYLINLSYNCFIPFLSSNFKYVQKAPFYDRIFSDLVFDDEKMKIRALLDGGRAVLFTEYLQLVPRNYKVVMAAKNPGIPYLEQIMYVAIPRNTM